MAEYGSSNLNSPGGTDEIHEDRDDGIVPNSPVVISRSPVVINCSPTKSVSSKDSMEADQSSQSDTRDATLTPTIKLLRPRSEDDAIPLPSPFNLPKHYRSDVEMGLEIGKMTKETMSSFLSSVAAAMLVHKRYPTKDDYVCVARSVIEKYTFMSSPTGTPYVCCLFLVLFRAEGVLCKSFAYLPSGYCLLSSINLH